LSPSPRHCLTLGSYFFRHPRASSWHDPWPVRFLRGFLDGTHQRLSLNPRFKFFIILYQQRFPRLFLEFSHTYTYRWTQFKHGGHRWWRRRWYSSNFHCHCRAALLSAVATSTGSVRSVRGRQAARIQRTYGSSSSANVGSGNGCVVIARDDHLSAEALRMCFRSPAYVCSCVLFLL
jgi:hypothetical protein